MQRDTPSFLDEKQLRIANKYSFKERKRKKKITMGIKYKTNALLTGSEGEI